MRDDSRRAAVAQRQVRPHTHTIPAHSDRYSAKPPSGLGVSELLRYKNDVETPLRTRYPPDGCRVSDPPVQNSDVRANVGDSSLHGLLVG